MSDKLIIFDTTLRDGEQAPGIALSPDDKVAIATQLAKLRVDVIEAGFAASSPGDFEAVSRIASEVRGPTIASLARTHPDDIDQAADALVKEGAEFRIRDLVLRPPARFARSYLLRRGFRDGMAGFIIAVASAFYVFLKYAKHWERSRVSGERDRRG